MQTQVMQPVSVKYIPFNQTPYQLLLTEEEGDLMRFLIQYGQCYCPRYLAEIGFSHLKYSHFLQFDSIDQIEQLKQLMMKVITSDEIYRFAKREAYYLAEQDRDYVEMYELNEESRSQQQWVTWLLAGYDRLQCVKPALLEKLRRLTQA